MNKTNLAVNYDFENIENICKMNLKKRVNGYSRPVYNIVKRSFDIVAGLLGTILLIPMTIIVIFIRIVKKENHGSIFFKQSRIGKNGKVINIYKYRTMITDADEKIDKYLQENPEAKKEYEKYKKLKNDPRITKVGQVLRKISVDEFPQFINVLLGQMSVVGPRPYLHKEKIDMNEYYEEIIKIKPGITGYWQVNGGNDVDFNDRLIMDEYYIKNRNCIMDIKIMIKTILRIFKNNI